MLELKNVNKFYNHNGITNLGLRNINLKFNTNEIVAITGESGSGKSTLLNVITKLDAFDDGEIYYLGNETSYFSIDDMDDFRKNKVGFIFQNYNIIDSYTVLENVMLPLKLNNVSNEIARKKALELIKKVGLSNKINNRGSKLSGGEKQRCVIARALASDCKILACDEPTGNLDSKTSMEIINLLKEVSKDKLVLIVTHDYEYVKGLATRKIKMHDGEVVEDLKITEFSDDIDDVLDLDYKPLPKKINISIAKNNILFTPKKTFFIFSVFFVISFFLLLLFQLIQTSYISVEHNLNYKVQAENKLVIYNKKGEPLDKTKLKGTYVINPFYINDQYTLEYDDDFISFNFDPYLKYELSSGNDNFKEENDILLIFPRDYSKSVIKKIMQSKETYINIYNDKINITGYGYNDYIEKPVVISKNFTPKNSITFKSNVGKSVFYDESLTRIKLEIPFTETTPPILYLKHFSKTYEVSKEYYDIIYTNKNIAAIHVPTKDVEVDCFFAAIYTDNIKEDKEYYESLGYICDVVKDSKSSQDLDLFIQNIVYYALILVSSIILIILSIVTYFILFKVYNSKSKDYEILRTLGVCKKDMKNIVLYETMFISCFASIFNYIVSTILLYSIKPLEFLRPIRISTTLIYFIALFIFGVNIARLFNKRLFKYSVTTSLKGDDFSD